MFELWGRFWTEFWREPVFEQVSFLVPFLGLPTLIGVFTGWSTKARLKKLAAGREAENELLRDEVDRLRASSFQVSLEEAGSSDDAYVATDLELVFERNKGDIAAACEHIANQRIVRWWQSGQEEDLNTAIHFARVLLTLYPMNVIGRAIITVSNQKSRNYHDDFASSPTNPDGPITDGVLLDRTVILLCEKIADYLAKGAVDDAILYSKYSLLHVKAQGDICSESGYNVLYWLVRSLIMKYSRRDISSEVKAEIESTAEYFADISEATFPDKDHLAQFVSKFHFATALHMVGKNKECLKVLQDDDLPGRVGACVGADSSACFATRHLYANVLYETHRQIEAEEVVATLKTDLDAAGKLSKGHISTYDQWAAQARTQRYRSGHHVDFRNAANLVY